VAKVECKGANNFFSDHAVFWVALNLAGVQGPAGPVAGNNGQIVYNYNNTAAGAELYYLPASGTLAVGAGQTNSEMKLHVQGFAQLDVGSGEPCISPGQGGILG
jgi:hypothetical protein